MNDTTAIRKFLLQATRLVLKSDSNELNKIEEYYLITAKDDEKITPYWLLTDPNLPRREMQNPEEEPASKDSMSKMSIQFEEIDKSEYVDIGKRKVIESFVTTDDNSAGKLVHISQRLASCFQHDRHSNKLDIIAELSMFRKDMLQLHVKKHQGGGKFSWFTKSNKSRREQQLDPYEFEQVSDPEYADLHFEILNTQPAAFGRPESSTVNSQSKIKETKKGCEIILKQIYELERKSEGNE